MVVGRFVADLITVTNPTLSPVVKTPADFGIEYEDVSFKTDDGVTLGGWLCVKNADSDETGSLPTDFKGAIIISHFGVQASRSGYVPKGLMAPYRQDVEFLQITKQLLSAGYAVLQYDLRNHGNSGAGPCPYSTGGVAESSDVVAAVDFVTERFPALPIGLLSFCMGCNSTTFAFGTKGLGERKNVKALIAVQPNGNAQFLEAYGFPRFVVQMANDVNMKRGGLDLYANCVDHAAAVTVPTMVVQWDKDTWTDMDMVKRYHEDLTVEKEMMWITDASHRFDTYRYFGEKPDKMLEWFEKHF